MKQILSWGLLIILFQSCKKESLPNISELANQTAINEVKNIVGESGKVFIIESNKQSKNDLIKTNSIDSSIKKLTIEEFKKVYSQIKNDTLTHSLIQITDDQTFVDPAKNVVFSLKKNEDEIEDPKPAGLYRYAYWPFQNGNSSFFTRLNISFNANSDGSINGMPVIYFVGINLFSWEPQQSSLISFNPKTFTSTYAITGVNVFGIQTTGGLTVGWSSNETYLINICLDQNSQDPVIISTIK
jgi:hypothetical protein